MAYEPYVNSDEYLSLGYDIIPQEDRDKALLTASRHIDSLTFNRIVGKGIDNLAVYQQDLIKEVVCEQAEFEYENADVIDTILTSYSINGVSMSFGASWNVHVENGVAMKTDIYSKLKQTGLCCRLL
ncbi:MAG: hypothetical protein K6G88_05660 [Lachnospiraceae bacterium]|nr:hypothetical protein [Lachnospiraceae bacterium]